MNTNIEVLRELDELVEAARLLGVTQAKKGFGCHTDEDRRFERAMYESIDKHRAALLDWEAKQPAPQQPAAGDEAAAIRAFEEHFQASSEDPYFERELELWLTAWRKALATQQQEPTT